jgi:hypothetical protein
MIEIVDAVKVVEVISKNLDGISKNTSNFRKLPDTFWGYFAKGHDQKGKFAVILTYSEQGSDVDELLKMYEEWVTKNKTKQ